MNTANLQLEGVYAILAALFSALRDKAYLNSNEIDELLTSVEKTLASDPTRPSELREANVDAICFPARFLRLALQASAAGEQLSFTQIATKVGQTKTER